MIITSGQSKLT